tara:strand:- start:199819 stop:200223 length:405 start_codon:yes stop_codon:yes gene_type:complete
MIILICSTIYAESTPKVTLLDSDCKMMGTIEDKIDINNNSSKLKTYCELKTKNLLKCSSIDPDNDKIVSQLEYIVYATSNKEGKLESIVGSSKSGNIKFTLNYATKKYQWGQVNILASGAVITTKYCVGNLVFN